ncbi:exo-1-4-beta-xylosidase xlnD [Penicillium macrosclerotiorum]|uniref:exo-1-4-beta-xylosidase xlnD n=1 Tax=Penicillium macrosclerotiorum TaxID=303699 RepID=UPI0025480F28|nr:exo-1-4-beta-xylosidase xlnD [Penicillium macrosclerotiorum]KAJ5682998.1 exo-1-4-beta-xylosidase xlnD [Penicillium macrosclerotiorum]
MPPFALLAVLAALAPTTFAQANTSYVDYSTEPQPNLDEQTLATIDLWFPDCSSGPLSKNLVCDSSARPHDRAAALVSLFTLEELVKSTGNDIPEIPRLGLPPYQVWSEALHGLDRANFSDSGDYSWSTSFPSPILTMAALNRTLINQIGAIISTQGRAFNNAGRYGLDVYAPNINSFRHPVWGRGQETPGEDAYCLCSSYAYEYITGIQGGVDPEALKLVATAKHYAGYDIENWNGHSRLGNDMNITQQDLAEYFTPQFLTAVRDARVHSVMSSYNSVNGVPSSANSFLLQTLLRDEWGFVEDGYVSSDCDAVYNVWNPHEYAANITGASADSMRAGTDIDCGTSYQYHLNESFFQGEISRTEIERGVIRLYSNLVRLGYFDGNDSQYRDLTWSDVLVTDAWNISYEAAVEGIVLLKNDGTLPLSKKLNKVALVGPWANATEQMQGNYYGAAPYLTSPWTALKESGLTVNYALGTNISSDSTELFSDAISAAKKSDVIIFAGGIDNTIEAEGMDRQNITWPGNQLQLIKQLSNLGKPLIVLQMGGGQVDSSELKENKKVNALIWGGYPGQSGGAALSDIITGKRAPAGRLPVTQYPAEYALQFPATDMSLRPSGSNPGQTYIWYTEKPVYEFGHGLFYTTFDISPANSKDASNGASFDISNLLSRSHTGYNVIEQLPFLNYTVTVTNTGKTTSDYTAMLFINTSAGPKPLPNKWLVGYDRIGSVKPNTSQKMIIPVSLDNVARTDLQGNRVLYPGKYELALNNERSAVLSFTLTGDATVISKWPLDQQQIPPA